MDATGEGEVLQNRNSRPAGGSSTDEEQYTTRYPNGRNRQSQGYYLPVKYCPGESEPYVLPNGTNFCPIEGCPAYVSKREFRPHWRVNEHMKTRHGWPRKGNQPPSDRRANALRKNSISSMADDSQSKVGRSRSSILSNETLGSTSSKRKYMAGMQDDSDAAADSSTHLDSSFIEPSPSGRPRRDRRQTAKGKEMANSMAQLAAATGTRPEKKFRGSDESVDDSLDEGDGHDSVPSTPKEVESLRRSQRPRASAGRAFQTPLSVPSMPPPRPPRFPEDMRDPALVDMIRTIINELRIAAQHSPELIKSANDYEDLLRRNVARVNCILRGRDALALASCYQRLAERYNARANIYTMQPPGLMARPHSRPTSQHRSPSQPMLPSPPKSFTFVNDAPTSSKSTGSGATSGFRPINQRPLPPPPPPAPTPDSIAPKPIMLKLKMTPSKESAVSA